MVDRRFRIDDDAERHDRMVVGGSPLKLFKLTEAGDRVLDKIQMGLPVDASPLVESLLDAGAIHPAPLQPARLTESDVTVVVPTLGPAPHAPTAAVVVDDGSQPSVSGAAIRLDPNRGPAAARNAGLRTVTTQLVAFVDSDIELGGDWLAHLLPHFNDDRVAVVAPRVVSMPGASTLASYEATHSPLDLGERAGRVRSGTRIGYVPSATIVCRVDALRDVGGFDETLRVGEDVNLVWKLDEAGWRVRYEPAAMVQHAPRPDWCAWLSQRAGYGSSAAPLALRHPGSLAPLRLNVWSAATWILGIYVHPVLGGTVAAGSAAALVFKLREIPPRSAFRLAWRGNLRAGAQIATAIRRAWWPLVMVSAVVSRRSRIALALSVAASGHPLRLLDDVAYSVGVWRGVIAHRTVDPLVPDLGSGPGRRRRSRSAHAVDAQRSRYRAST